MDYKQHIKNLLLTNKDAILNTNKNKSSAALVDIFEAEMNNFEYNGQHDITYLFDMFDLLIVLLNNQPHLQTQYYDRFTMIHNTIKNLLHAAPENMSKNEMSRYKILQNIIKKMENTMLVIYFESPGDPAEYNPNKEEFIYYIVFKLKYINFVNSACEKFPHIVNSVDKDGIPLVEKVLEKYIEALDAYLSKENLGPIDDLIYYDKVMNIFLQSEKIKIDDYNRRLMLEKLKDYAQSKNFTSNRHKEKLSFFINNMINTISGIKEKVTIDSLSYKYEIHNRFKEAHNLEAKCIYLANKDIGKPTTLREIYTFDGVDAKEIDDGLSITYEDGIYHLGVHIADPGSYIPFNSILMDEATKRTTSLYMEDGYCIPLFPLILSGNTMSLNAGKSTYCMSYYFDIDERTGELINFDIKNEICQIKANLTYDYFNECIDKGTDDKALFETLINLTNVSEILKRVYNEYDVYQQFHNNKNNSLSTSVIESAMIYTNHHIAKKFNEMDLPFIYRCHTIDEKSIKQLTELQERLRQTNGNDKIARDIEMIKNLLPRAYYTSTNTGHFGLGMEFYSHSTSPLRRLADNIANLCIKKFLLNKYTKEDIKIMTELINEIAETINSKRASVDDYEIQYMKIKHPTNK